MSSPTGDPPRRRLQLLPKSKQDYPKCRQCGDVISSGTFGAIYVSTESPVEVIKGSLTHRTGLGCPEDFKNEFRMALFVEHFLKIFQSCPWYTSSKRPWKGRRLVHTAGVHSWRMENGACFYTMDRIFPLEEELVELTPGYSTDRTSKGVVKGGKSWIKLGASSTGDLLKRLFGLTLQDWATYLGRFAGLCHRFGLILNDVEFIVGRLGPDHPPQIFLVDFDKCYVTKPGGCADVEIDSIQRLTLHQFPTQEPAFKTAYAKTLCPPGGAVDEASPLKTITPETMRELQLQINAQMHCAGC
jgi:hypothetical protein